VVVVPGSISSTLVAGPGGKDFSRLLQFQVSGVGRKARRLYIYGTI
jgi:hypothetical protein